MTLLTETEQVHRLISEHVCIFKPGKGLKALRSADQAAKFKTTVKVFQSVNVHFIFY